MQRKVSKWLCPKHPSSVSASKSWLLNQKCPSNSVFFGHASGHRHCELQKEIQILYSSLKWLSSKTGRAWHCSGFLQCCNSFVGSQGSPWLRLNLYQGNCGKQKGPGWVSASAAFFLGPNLWNTGDMPSKRATGSCRSVGSPDFPWIS